MIKPHYNNGDKVQVALSGDTNNIVYGTIIGIVSEHVIDIWIVRFDKRLDFYPYEAAPVQHTFIRKLGDNKPFLCELGKFSHDQ